MTRLRLLRIGWLIGTGLFALLFVWVVPPSFASLTVIDPHGNPPNDHFTDFTMVPGDTQSTEVFLSQNTEDTVRAGIRFEPLSEPSELHDAIEITVEALGSAHTMSLTDAVQSDSTLWLGDLQPHQRSEVLLTAHFPFGSGNETQRTEAPFRLVFTAQQISPGEAVVSESGSVQSDDSTVDSTLDGPHDRPLPRTGMETLSLVLLALALLVVGIAAFGATRSNHE